MTSSERYWSPVKVLGIEDHSTCVGHAPSKGRKCQNPIKAANRQWGLKILSTMSGHDPSTTNMKPYLEELAPTILCQRNHQGQAGVMIDRWLSSIARLQIRLSDLVLEDSITESRLPSRRRTHADAPIINEPQMFATSTIEPTASDTTSTTTTARTPTSQIVSQTRHIAIAARPIAPLRVRPRQFSARTSVGSTPPADPQNLQPGNPPPQVQDAVDRFETSTDSEALPIQETLPTPETTVALGSETLREAVVEARVAFETASEHASEQPAPVLTPESDPEPAPEPAIEQESANRTTSPVPIADPSTEEQDHHEVSPLPNLDECSICYESLPANVGVSSHCGHSFHAGCINTWFNVPGSPARARACPYCRSHWRRQDVEGICSICQDALHDDTEPDADASGRLVWCKSSCGHNFHLGCMHSWLAVSDMNQNSGTCPDCRAEWVA